MTYFLNLRAGDYGAVCSPQLLIGDGTQAPQGMTALYQDALPILVKGKDVLLAAHGFNVGYSESLYSLGRLEQALAIAPNEFFLGVSWPGDWVIPAINYPFEDKIASHAGAVLGAFCNSYLKTARSISFLSHSLGARVVLEAVKASTRTVRMLCITAGAVNADCLTSEYQAAAQNCQQIRTLSSMKDLVLEFAYPPGDFLGDILDPDHALFEPALGRGGPESPYEASVHPWEIPDGADYDHSDYFPPSAAIMPPPSPADKWRAAVTFMASAYRAQTPSWP